MRQPHQLDVASLRALELTFGQWTLFSVDQEALGLQQDLCAFRSSRFAMPREAAPVRKRGPRTRVSNVAAATPSSW